MPLSTQGVYLAEMRQRDGRRCEGTRQEGAVITTDDFRFGEMSRRVDALAGGYQHAWRLGVWLRTRKYGDGRRLVCWQTARECGLLRVARRMCVANSLRRDDMRRSDAYGSDASMARIASFSRGANYYYRWQICRQGWYRIASI